jgi:hypothetical protein
VDCHFRGAGAVPAATAQAQIEFLTGMLKEKRRLTMNGTAMQAILWIVAGFFLTLLIIRRGKRKARG